VDAYRSIGEIPVPIIIRLQGTNAKEAKDLIDNSDLKVYSAIGLEDASNLVSELID
jgi:succinyl-CoA synthetase beta subunit